MSAATQEQAPEGLIERVQELQERLDGGGDDAVRRLADELVSAVVQMYGAGLERILRRLHDAGPQGEQILAGLPEDRFLATLLLIHDLHPVPLEDRVQAALDSVRPYMESHGGDVQLLSLQDGVVRLRLQGSCSDCSASAVTLELAIKQALEESAPDLAGLEVEGIVDQSAAMGGVALPMAGTSGPGSPELPIVMVGPGGSASGAEEAASGAASTAAAAWFELDSVAELAEGALAPVALAGQELVLANVQGTLLAYRNQCAACGARLDEGTLTAGALACPGCQRSFFLPAAGRSLDDERVQLLPVPLLREDGHVRVALAG